MRTFQKLIEFKFDTIRDILFLKLYCFLLHKITRSRLRFVARLIKKKTGLVYISDRELRNTVETFYSSASENVE